MNPAAGVLAKRYSELSTDRNPYLSRGRTCSRYTIPSLLPPEGHSGSTKLKTTFSSYGARLVNSLASKLLLALLPAGQPFFVFTVDEQAKARLGLPPQAEAEVQKGLQKMETSVMQEIETSRTRAPLRDAVRHLIVAGNALLQLLPNGDLRMFGLDRYVCKRSPSGALLELVIHEKVSKLEIPAEILAIIAQDTRYKRDDAKDSYDLYTGIKRTDEGWTVTQEVCGVEIPRGRGKFDHGELPWMALRWNAVSCEDYGRGQVEEYLGDLMSLEGLMGASVKAAAIAARVIFLRDPNSQTTAKQFSSTESGGVVNAKPTDFTPLQVQKHADMAFVKELLVELKRDLAFAFLMHNAVQRDAERVTAEEIRMLASELDTELGGIFSTLSIEFQHPFLSRLVVQMQRADRLPKLPKGIVKPIIVTGIEALGRGADLQNLRDFVKDVAELGGPQALSNELNFDDLLTRLATARRVKAEGLIKTPEQKQQAQQTAMLQQILDRLGPNAVTQAGQLAQQSMANQAPTK